MYTHTFEQTNTTIVPFPDVNGDRIGLQVQWNF
jgi:hypothetical protein